MAMHELNAMCDEFDVQRRALKLTIKTLGLPDKDTYEEDEYQLIKKAKQMMAEQNLSNEQVADAICGVDKTGAVKRTRKIPGAAKQKQLVDGINRVIEEVDPSDDELAQAVIAIMEGKIDGLFQALIPFIPDMMSASAQRHSGELRSTIDGAIARQNEQMKAAVQRHFAARRNGRGIEPAPERTLKG